MRLVAWLLALAGLQSTPANPPSARGDPRSATREPSVVQTVRIDLVARDARGRVLENLKTSDFQLREDLGQPINDVRLIRPSTDQARLVAIFLDEYHISRDATDRVRRALTSFVDELRVNDLLVVMRPLDSIFAIRLTTDRARARAALQGLEGRRGEYDARNAYERNFMAGTPARIESSRTQVALSALNALASHLARFPDQRKALIVVTEGFGRVERRRGLEYLPTVETIIRSADRANVAIYPISPAEVAPDDRGVEAIRTLAAETSGQALAPDLEAGLRRALDDSSGYYLLTYRAVRPEDGRFHAVQVQVNRPGAQVQARKGYFATSPDEALRAALPARATDAKGAKPPEPAPHVSPLIRPWFGTSRGTNGKTQITFVWEPTSRYSADRLRRVPSRLVLTALAPDDSVVFEGPLLPTGPVTLDEPGGPATRAVFEIPPGRLRVRMSIQDAAERVLDSDVRSINVRDMKGGITISTPEVMRARNAREFRALEAEAAVPVASREFSRAERLLVRFRAYGPDDTTPTVTARLRSRMGGVMRELPVTLSPLAGAPSEINLSLAGLAAGEYLIEITAAGAGGEATDVIDFRVTT